MWHVLHCALIAMFLKTVQSHAFHMKLPKVNVTDFNMTSHLAVSHIKKVCDQRDSICKVNNSIVCAIRKINETFQYEDFENSCYLFLSNMCDYPGKEFAIVEGESCKIYLKSNSRRHYVTSGVTQESQDIPEAGSPNYTSWVHGNTTKPGLRGSSFSTLYEVDTAYDGHICPLSCPNLYSPVCVSVNRGMGQYLKFFQFVNHCESYKYYCKHWQDFQPPPDMDEEMIDSSPLGWSYCGASKYLQFNLLSQAASSMGHYGWLEGDYRFTKILEPSQRKPGYG